MGAAGNADSGAATTSSLIAKMRRMTLNLQSSTRKPGHARSTRPTDPIARQTPLPRIVQIEEDI